MEKCLLTVVQRHPSKAVQVSNDIFALLPLMLSHGGTKGGGERRRCLVLYGKCQVPRASMWWALTVPSGLSLPEMLAVMISLT